MHYPEALETLIEQLRKLPSVGHKSAERLAFALIDWKETELKQFADAVAHIKERLKFCSSCGAMLNQETCPYCSSVRDAHKLCIVANAKDIYLFEQTGEYKGLYHVLEEVLSPLHHKAPSTQHLEKLKKRILDKGVQEVILALDATLEGDATALYLKKELQGMNLSVSRLALGIPMGSSLDYIDGGTLARAFSGRNPFS